MIFSGHVQWIKPGGVGELDFGSDSDVQQGFFKTQPFHVYVYQI